MGSTILRAGGKRRLDPETLGVGGRRRELQGVGTATAWLPSVPSAPPCVPCICGSERGAGHCLPELAEFPVVLGAGGEAVELRACQEGNSHGPESRLSYSFFLCYFMERWSGGWGRSRWSVGAVVCLTGEQNFPGLQGRRPPEWS